MKPLKKAKQKNVILNRYYYTELDLKYLLIHGDIFYFSGILDERHVWTDEIDKDTVFRIFLEDVSELKVIYDKDYETYITVAILENGNTLYVEL